MRRVLKYLVGLVLLAAVAVGSYAFVRSHKPGDGGIKLVDVTTGSITEKALAVGQIDPRLKFHVKSKISGNVKRCAVEVGDVVKPGDVLFEIVPDPTPTELIEAQRQVDSTRSAYTRAEADYGRARELQRQGVLPQGQLDASKDTYEQARIEQARARDGLDLIQKGRVTGGGQALESVVRAPAGGVVLERLVNPGDPVVPLTSYQAGTDMATIADMHELLFKGTVDEIDVGKLQAGLPARLKVGALPEAAVTGHLSRIAPQAREKDGARLFDVEIELDPAAGVTLRAGYSATADVVIREKKDILIVPERLVQFEADGKKAFVEVPAADPASEPKKVAVDTGLSDGLNIEVTSGLKKGDKVVQRPPKEIKPS